MPSLESILGQAGFAVADMGGVEADANGLLVKEPSAAIRLVPTRPLAPGLYDVEVAFGAGPWADVAFDFAYGNAEGAQLRTVPIGYAGQGRYRSVCHVPERLSGIVIRPNAAGGRLAIERFRVTRLGALARLKLLGGRALELLLRDPRALFAALRRYRAGVARGDVIVSRRGADTRPGDYGAWLKTFDDDPVRDAPLYRERMARAAPLPSFAVFLPLDGFDPAKLDRTIASLEAQLHDAWELHLVAGADLKPWLGDLAAAGPERDRRIRVSVGQPGDEPATGLNDALARAGGDWALTLRPGDVLRPHALAELGLAAAAEPAAELVYSDEDRLDAEGGRHAPAFKPDWSPDLLRSWNYLGRLTAWRTGHLRRLGGWREGFGPARDHDLNLRATEALPPERIRHVAKVLVHVADGAPDPSGAPDEAAAASARAVAEHLARTGRPARVEPVPGRSVLRLRYALPPPPPLVSIVIPTRDRLALLRGCMESILDKTTYPAFEVVVVDNASREPETLAWFGKIAADGRVRILPYPGPFNFSAINNFAVAQARGDVIALVNNDIEVVAPDWLDEMAGHALRPEIGCVGAKLLYPDGTVQHAGVVLGLGGLAGHAHKGLGRTEPGYAGRAIAACNVSAVTAACLVVRRAVYDEVGGLDEELAVAFNDVDFCLKVLGKGYFNLWTPFAELYHHESASRGAETSRTQAERFAAEIQVMKRRWGPALHRDPYYSAQLTVLREDYSLRP
ncbi:MAG TPA: glycosyltransferase family 2 protein [Beijerinckiaceae bacterium]|jgi:GT2 family glycosyltransferase